MFINMPSHSHQDALPPLSARDSEIARGLRRHVGTIAGEIGGRSVGRYEGLIRAADYINSEFSALGLQTTDQPFPSRGVIVKNIEAEVPGAGRAGEIVIVGAHYDTAGGLPGANDNASGVAAMLEICRILRARQGGRTLRFVAFVNEEPPYFQTSEMGSLVYARRCRERGEEITAMISLETIGYYSDAPGSQHYPSAFGLFYPDRANFISFVGGLRSRALVRRAIGTFRRTTPFPSEGGALPSGIPGIGWSDHWSFWQQGYPAIMVTDTALFRYPYYHTPEDTPDKLEYERMARVVGGLVRVVEDLVWGD